MKNRLITIMFMLYILVFSVGSLAAGDRSFSELENRNLAKKPSFNIGALLDGSYTSGLEDYMSDQLICKDFLVKLKVTENRLINQTYINGVYFGSDDMLIQGYDNPYGQLSKNISYVNEFAEANPDLEITWLIAPNACYIYEDKLPVYAQCYDQGEVMAYIVGNTSDNINIADCTSSLMEHRDEYIYYKTDHHWSMHGAYIGYTVLCDALGTKAVPEGNYDIIVGSDSFYGSLYSKAPDFVQKPDTITLYINPDGIYSVYYYDTGLSTDSLYNMDNLLIKDKYTTYLDGNHSMLKITGNAENDEKILVIKDSYAHSLLPLLADNYSEIYVVDLRYYHQSVSELAHELGIERLVFINNIDFISTDDNYLWLQ